MQELKGLSIRELADIAPDALDAVRLELMRRIDKGGPSRGRASSALAFIDAGLRESIQWS